MSEELELFCCMDCGRRELYLAGRENSEVCFACGGLLLSVRRSGSRRRPVDPDEALAQVQVEGEPRYCAFCKSKLRATNPNPVCTSRRCWRQYHVLTLYLGDARGLEKLSLCEYRKLGDASYLRGRAKTLGGHLYSICGHLLVTDKQPGLEFDGTAKKIKVKK